MKNSRFKKTGYILQLVPDDTGIYRDNFKDNIDVISKATMLNLQEMQEYVLGLLRLEYIHLKMCWLHNLNLVSDIIDDIYSRILWSNYQISSGKIFTSNNLNEAQLVWVFLNKKKDQNEAHDNQFKLFDYLAYISNPEMRSQMDKYREETRENIAFDSMHEALINDNLDGIK